MDADFSHNPRFGETLFSMCWRGACWFISRLTRYATGVKRWWIGLWVGCSCLTLPVDSLRWSPAFRLKTQQPVCLFFQKGALKPLICHDKICGLGFQIEMKFTTWSMAKIKRCPSFARIEPRANQKMSSGIFKEAFLAFFKWPCAVGSKSIFRP